MFGIDMICQLFSNLLGGNITYSLSLSAISTGSQIELLSLGRQTWLDQWIFLHIIYNLHNYNINPMFYRNFDYPRAAPSVMSFKICLSAPRRVNDDPRARVVKQKLQFYQKYNNHMNVPSARSSGHATLIILALDIAN